MDDPILYAFDDCNLYDFYVAVGKAMGKSAASRRQVEAISLFNMPEDVEAGDYGWVNYGCVDDTVELTDMLGWTLDEVAELTDEQAALYQKALASAQANATSWGISLPKVLSPCCKAETFLDGSRRVCDKCRLSRPL